MRARKRTKSQGHLSPVKELGTLTKETGFFYHFCSLFCINFLICWMRLSSSKEIASSYLTSLFMLITPNME